MITTNPQSNKADSAQEVMPGGLEGLWE